ncbi:MAG: leucine-rich repeat domain-containing protein [Ruminococcaceae bacterium]|nr:leucine-rich repeat domain-containing protein [Oscillospiraceae bacterium]
MKRVLKRLIPILLCLVVIFSIIWYLFWYDRGFTQELLLGTARFFEQHGNHSVASWLYKQAYNQTGNDDSIVIELANRFKEAGNYTQAEIALTNAIAEGGSVDLYLALSKTYVEQDKLLDAANMLENITNPEIKAQLDEMRPAAPVASPAPGFYSQYMNVQVNAAPTDRLFITTTGDFPSLKDEGNRDITLVGGENAIYAIAVGENGLVSVPSYFGYTVGGVIEEVSISDSVLDAYIRNELDIGADTQLFTSDLWKITSLTVPEGVEDFTDIGRLIYLETLVIDSRSIDHLEMLSTLAQLKELTVRNSPLSATDLAVIAKLPMLEKLTLSGCSLSNITPLSEASKLTYLDLSRNAIADVSPLSFMENLTTLDLNNNALSNLNALSALENLEVLDVSFNSLTSIAPLSVCPSLKGLIANNNQISEIPVFQNPSVLSILTISNNNLTNVEPLSQYTSLTGLNIAYNQIKDITPLASLKQLVSVDFSHNQVTALPTWDKSSMLVVLDGSYNKISSVKPLRGLMFLNKVVLDYNKITNVDALADCPLMAEVSIYGNSVKDVSKLTDLSIIVYHIP